MKHALITAAALGFMLAPVLADKPVPLRDGDPYSSARRALGAAGWTPARGGQDCGGREDVCTAYQETEACSGTGLGFCSFVFTDGSGITLRVVTTGEDVRDLIIWNWIVNPCADGEVCEDEAQDCGIYTSTDEAPGERVLTFEEGLSQPDFTIREGGKTTKFGIMSGAVAFDLSRPGSDGYAVLKRDDSWRVGTEVFEPYCN
ncbi:hypothetical protein VSX64_23480 [Aurantimonas sp. C2-6-R+9]|uniref:hypothetical protein n=1 Tax=unclassified Aurantimonas TaxID=2638230 RepID=UPI002E1859C8|nr:hypothetical protein [Aurantimonas sp. C2-6-R+9]